MIKEQVAKGLLVSAIALTLGSGVAAAQQNSSDGLIGDVAAVLAARSDVFQATTASLDVVPMNMAGSCPRAFAFNVSVGAQSPGTLSYQIVTDDGRESQVFKAQTRATEDGLFAAQASHKLALVESEQTEADASIVVFDRPENPTPAREPDFFERLFGTGPAAEPYDPQGLRNQAFKVKVVAPNEVVSAFDSLSVSCEPQRTPRVVPATESQRDPGDRDRGGRDPGGRDPGGRDSGGTGGGGSGPSGTP
ncbi:RNA methyltransferase [Pelagibius litoralis]|uniref:RNA methyltransferase n=1 Tax=Pelagibius litoralis TaxID=374515 RepID=A0A967F3A1_9PROT|nr:RNA methyltransferase [Pelagibius litoralis]NIA72203.1 RNA methyltransferase [Pelagibius litoralis]